MSISQVVLFTSTTSQKSIPCRQFIHQYQLPIQEVRLDTEESRKTASEGQYVQITSVPSLMVTYTDGNMQLFVGTDKIMAWMRSAVMSMQQRSSPPETNEPQTNIEDDRVNRTKETKPKKTTYVVEEEDEDDVVEEPTPLSKPKKTTKLAKSASKMKSGKTTKKKKTRTITKEENDLTNETDEVDIEFIDSSGRPPPPPTKGLMVGPGSVQSKSSMTNLMKKAQQMAKDREKTLGYREEDLPVHN